MMSNLYVETRHWLNSEEGQDLAEYGMLLGLIAVIVMVAVAVFGESLLTLFDRLAAVVAAWSRGGTA